jgi:hypothetical protein
MNAYARRGQAAAVTSFDQQSNTVVALFGRVPLPSGAVPDAYGEGQMNFQVVANEDQARSAYLYARNPLRGLRDALCLDVCPIGWVPDDGLLVSQSFQVDTKTPPTAGLCDELGRNLGQVFGGAVQPEPIKDEFKRGIDCAFSGRINDAVLQIAVQHMAAQGIATIRLEAGTRGNNGACQAV